MDELILGYKDYLNYKALCALVTDIPWKLGKRRYQWDTLSTGAIRIQLQKQDYKCPYCGGGFKYNGARFVDTTTEHVIPFRYGGSVNKHNTLVVHSKCNQKKANEPALAVVEQHYGPIDLTMIETWIPPMTSKEYSNYERRSQDNHSRAS